MKVNLGCGNRYRHGWVNLDYTSRSDNVLSHDLSRSLPFSDNCADLIYASHVLEHFRYVDGIRLLREVHRVLVPGGIVRIVVPDLEKLVYNYLCNLQNRRNDSNLDSTDYLWSILAIFDQVARNQSGGEMLNFLRERPSNLLENVFKQEGTEIRSLHAGLVTTSGLSPDFSTRHSITSLIRRTKDWLLGVTFAVFGGAMYRVGRFRLSGEVHYCMYDSLRLSDALSEAGFRDIVVRAATESYSKGWINENLDTEDDGRVYKPLSLFMEARKLA